MVGAGVAGLAAADRLGRAGKKVLLLEARTRLGGRVHTILDPEYGHPVELGAEFLEGDPEELRGLAREAGLEFYEIDERHERAESGERRPMVDVEDLIDRLLAGAESPDQDVPVAQLIRQQAGEFAPDQLDSIRMYLEGFHGADLERFGTRALAENQQAERTDSERLRRIVGGHGQLVDHLRSSLEASIIEVRSASPVSRLRWQPGLVELTVAGHRETITAAQAIVTVPLEVLRGGLELDPVPDGWEEALAALQTGMAQRIDLGFEHPWWIESGRPAPIFVHGKDEPFPVWWTTSPPSMRFLTGWVGGPRAASVVGLSQHDLVDRALGSLSSIFGQQARTLRNGLQAVHAHDWSTDPYSRGAYSYGGVGARAAREVLRQPRADTLFLSGEALATEGRNATVAGALSSGLRAAAALLGKAV